MIVIDSLLLLFALASGIVFALVADGIIFLTVYTAACFCSVRLIKLDLEQRLQFKLAFYSFLVL